MNRRYTLIGIISLFIIGLVLIIGISLTQRNNSVTAQQNATPNQQRNSLTNSEIEARAMRVLDDLDRNQRAGNANVPVEDGRLLRILAESINAKHVVELGTSNGYSGIWMAIALKFTGGKLTTYEIDQRRAALALQNFQKAGVNDLVKLVLGDAHIEVTKLKEQIDLLFLDADKEGYLDYLNKLLPLVRTRGLIVAHNMRYPSPDPQFVRAITTNPNLETTFLNMSELGISVTLKKR